MIMYTVKFGDYNSLMGNIIMDEQTTLELLLEDEFGEKIPEEFLNITPDEWAKYSFEKNLPYVVTYYKNNKAFATVSNHRNSVGLSYYEEKENGLNIYMSISFMKGYIDNSSKNNGFIPYDKKVFFTELSIYGELGKTLLFYSEKKKNNVLLQEFREENGTVEYIEQFGTADLSKHWFDAPKDYLDFERYLDYQKLFEESPYMSK